MRSSAHPAEAGTVPLSVVIPAHNEAAAIEQVVREAHARTVARIPGSELIVVDDASTDGTAGIVEKLAAELPGIALVRLDRNVGHGPAVAEGLGRARGERILHIDGDGELDPDDFESLWRLRGEADLVLGVRRERHDPPIRLALSASVRRLVALLFGARVADPNVPFRILSRALWEDVAPLLPRAPLVPSILCVAAARTRGWRIAEAPVRHRPRTAGRSWLVGWKLVRFSLRALAEVLRFRRALAAAPPRKR